MSKAVDRPSLSNDAAMAPAGRRTARTNRGETKSSLNRFESLLEFDRCGWGGVSIDVRCGDGYRIGLIQRFPAVSILNNFLGPLGGLIFLGACHLGPLRASVC